MMRRGFVSTVRGFCGMGSSRLCCGFRTARRHSHCLLRMLGLVRLYGFARVAWCC